MKSLLPRLRSRILLVEKERENRRIHGGSMELLRMYLWFPNSRFDVFTTCTNTITKRDFEPSTPSEQRPISTFLDAAKFTNDNEGSFEKSTSYEDFRSWCRLVPSARKFLASLLKPSSPGSQVLHLVHQDIDSNMLLSREEYAWHIGGALSHEELGEWRLLYHSALNGLSFNTFLGNISWKC